MKERTKFWILLTLLALSIALLAYLFKSSQNILLG